MNLLEGNKLIADFMGVANVFEYDFGDNIKALYIAEDSDGCIDYEEEFNSLDYTDWNKLMPVIDKIEELDMSEYHYKWGEGDDERCNFMSFEFDMNYRSASVFMELSLDPCQRVAGDYNKKYETRIEAVWNAVVEFIQYYNEQVSMNEQLSLWEFLGRAAGMELGGQVHTAFKAEYPGQQMQRRYVNNKAYTGNVDLYPREFLERYFNKTK